MWDEDALLNICKKYRDDAPAGVVFDEPYLPYVPSQWNGILVLAEAQNLSMPDKNEYVKRLRKMSSEGRMKRLVPGPEGKIGVEPWDDGSVKLALKAIDRDIQLDRVAVSNAVPWSCVGERGNNVNPTLEMKERATRFWRELFAVWKPQLKLLVVLGNVARDLMREAGALKAYDYLKLRLPAPNLSISASLFDRSDLLDRYPEVLGAIQALKMIHPNHRQVFFACHAVSAYRRRLRGAS